MLRANLKCSPFERGIRASSKPMNCFRFKLKSPKMPWCDVSSFGQFAHTSLFPVH